MHDDVELIEISLSTFGKTFPLSRETSALIWDAVKRGEASSPEEYVNRKLEEYLFEVKDAPATAQAVSSTNQDRGPEAVTGQPAPNEDSK